MTGGTVQRVETGRLRLRLLGRFSIEGNLDRPLPSGKAQRLLKLLAAHHGQFVPVDLVIDALWGDETPHNADRNVAALVSRLRRCLGRPRIEGGPSGYRLILDEFTVVDVFEAEELLQAAERELSRRMYALAAVSAEQAVKLLAASRPLSDERDAPWAEELRRSCERQLRRARVCAWTAALELGEHRTAIEMAGDAVIVDPLDEEACRALMTGYQRDGEAGAALVAYKSLRAALAEQLGSDPSPASQALFLSILRSEVPTTSSRTRSPDPAAQPSPLVGRDSELARLLQLWSHAVNGHASMGLVVGEAGIGKSALVGALADQIRQTGGLVLATGCSEAERSLYLQPLVQAVRQAVARFDTRTVRDLSGEWLGTLIELVPELARLTGSVRYERVAPELEHRRSLEAIATFLDRVAERQPVMVVIEDLQHAGQSTIEALHFLATRWERERILVVATERMTEDPPAVAPLRDLGSCLQLQPLAMAAVTTLVAHSGLALDPARLYEWTGGSPLFVTELLRHPGPATTELGIPVSLHEAVAERLDHAGEDVALVLAQGAILGTAFSLDEVAALSGLDEEECARRAERALRAGLLVARGESFRFANDVVQQVAYESVPEPIRISRHRRAAKLFGTRPEAAAHQLAAARDWPEAANAWLLAAHAAHLAFANREADRLLTEALGSAERSGDRYLLATVRFRRGQIRTDLGRHDDARADHERALASARELGDEELEARVLEQLGWTALYARDALVAVDLAARASHLAESAAAAPGALPSSQLLLGRTRHWDGDYSGAASAYEQVLAAETGDTTTAIALAYRGALLQHMDRFTEAQSVLERAAVLCQRSGQFRPLLQTLFFTGLARGDVGDFEGALRALGRARRLLDTYGVSYYRAGIETTTSWLWQELGDVGRAREHAERAVELAHRGGGALELEQELHALLALADCDLMLGRDDNAGARVEAAAPMLERSLPFQPRATMRLWEMRSRWDPGLAEALLDYARTYSSAKYESLALRHLGRNEEAARKAATTGSDLLIGQLGGPGASRAAIDRITAALSPELRDTFVARGRLRGRNFRAY